MDSNIPELPLAGKKHYASTEAFLDIVELVIFHYNNYN